MARCGILPQKSTNLSQNDTYNLVDDIRHVQNWAGRHEICVPNKISYSPSPNRCEQWGYDIDNDSQVFHHLKRRLELSATSDLSQQLRFLSKLVYQASKANFDEEVPVVLTKSPDIVATDFLSRVA